MAVSLTGTRVSAVALPWFVLVTTGQHHQDRAGHLRRDGPYVVVKALTGPFVDRTGPRTVSWTTDPASAAAAAAIPLLHALHLLSFSLLLALVAVIGAARGPGDLAREVMVPEAAERGGVPLERATGFAGVTERLASTVGSAAGGSLVALPGPLTGIVINAGCFALGSVIVALTLPRRTRHAVAEASSQADEVAPGYWRQCSEGFAFLRGDPLLRTVIVMMGITNLLDAAITTVLIPIWAKESGNGPAAIGLMGGVMGGAVVAGSLIAAMAAHRLRRRVVVLSGFLLAGAPRFLILASDALLGSVLAVMAVSGFGAGFINPVMGAVLYERVPRRMLGRVNALGNSLAWAGIPLGRLSAGGAVAAVGPVPTLLACGAAYFLTTNLAGLRPEWRDMDRPGGRDVLTPTGVPPAGEIGSPVTTFRPCVDLNFRLKPVRYSICVAPGF